MIAFLKINILTLAAACILDWIIGDPRWLPHPVRLMGRMIGWLEGDLRPRFQGREKLAGTLLTAAMVLFWTAVPGLLFFILWTLCLGDGRALILLQGIFCSQLLAARDLQKESCLVGSFLKKGDLSGARASVSMIVGRDTKRLDEAGIARAAVETVAENTGGRSDRPHGVHRPLWTCGGIFLQGGQYHGFHDWLQQ